MKRAGSSFDDRPPPIRRGRAAIAMALLALAVASGGWSVAVAASGGLRFGVLGWTVSSAGPWRAALLAAGSLAFWLLLTRAPGERLRARLARAWPRAVTCAAVSLSIVIVAIAVRLSSYAASGADSSGYVSQAHRLAEGRLQTDEPLAASAPWPEATWTLAPLGYRPGVRPGTIVPSYAPGLPALMAAGLALVGPCAPYCVGPVCGGALVLLTFVLGRRLLPRAPALAAALLVAASPALLSQVVLPMSDTPAAVALTGALLLAGGGGWLSPLGAGMLTSCTVLIRPNLAVAAPAIAVAVVLGAPSAARGTPGSSPVRSRLERLALALAGTAPGVALVAMLNARLYGAPWQSGYGGLDHLYGLSNVWPNLVRYAEWLVTTNTPAVLVGVAGLVAWPWLMPADSRPRALAASMALLVLAVVGQYLCYASFEEWWYLRFLLPVWPVLMVMTAGAALWALTRLMRSHLAAGLVLAAGLGVAVTTSSNAYRLNVHRIWHLEQRYVDVARFAATALPSNTLFITAQHSGSLQFYTRRPIVRSDLLDPAWLDRAIEHLRQTGYRPVIVLEDWEVEGFRRRFAGANAAGRLDWCPAAVLPRPVMVFVYDAIERSCRQGTREIPALGRRDCEPVTGGSTVRGSGSGLSG